MKNIVTILKYKKYFGKGKKMGWKARPEEPPPPPMFFDLSPNIVHKTVIQVFLFDYLICNIAC